MRAYGGADGGHMCDRCAHMVAQMVGICVIDARGMGGHMVGGCVIDARIWWRRWCTGYVGDRNKERSGRFIGSYFLSHNSDHQSFLEYIYNIMVWLWCASFEGNNKIMIKY